MTANGNGNGRFGSRRRAYQAGARMARARMRREDPHAADALGAVEASDVVVVRGQYDRVEQVLDALELPYTAIDPEHLASTRLRPEQLMIVNCPGTIGHAAVDVVRRFVARGGSLFTTDWALRNVIELAFPGYVEYNGRPTGDDVVRIDVAEHDNPFLRGVLDSDDDPQWWLEGQSHPIRIVDPSRVQVLITSRELGARYGEAPVAVLFHYGRGEVFHMISHYYLQRTELRSARHQQTGTAYAMAKGLAGDASLMAMAEGLTVGELESAATSAKLMANLVAEKKRRMRADAERRRRASRRGPARGSGPEGETMA
jgi:hypothetical protein